MFHIFLFQLSRSSSVSSFEKKSDSEEPKDYIELYESDSEKFPPPPPAVHLYDFERESTASSSGGQEVFQEDKPKSLASMGDLVVGEVERLSVQEVSEINWLYFCYNISVS